MSDLPEMIQELLSGRCCVHVPTKEQRAEVVRVLKQYLPTDDYRYVDMPWDAQIWPYMKYRNLPCLSRGRETQEVYTCSDFCGAIEEYADQEPIDLTGLL